MQGRCLSIITDHVETSFDLVLQTTERRNELLNVMDLYLEWGKEEMDSIWNRQTLSASDMVRTCE